MKGRLLMGALFAILAGILVWMGVRTARQDQRIASLETLLRAAKERASPPPVAAVQPAAPGDTHEPPRVLTDARRPETGPKFNAEADELRTRLQESQNALTRVQSRVDELESKVQELTGERARLTGAEAEARAQLGELNRRVEELTAERPGHEKRLRDMEAENARLRDQTAAAAQRNSQLGRLAGEWQELAQRQQVYLTNALRRYREITDLFRRMPGMLELKGNGPELSRIQSAISMADEDLRQLNDLNARLGRVQKQIANPR